MHCIPPLTINSSYCLLQENFEALKWHMQHLDNAFNLGPQDVLSESQHYQEMYNRIIEATNLIEEIKNGNIAELLK